MAGAAALTLAIGAGVAFAAPGDLDATFGTNGRRVIEAGGDDHAYGLAVRGNGRIVTVGFGGPNADLLVTQLLPTGATDTTFGTAGTTAFDFTPGVAESGSAVGLEADGSAVAVGHTVGGDVGVAKLTPTGQPDPSFGPGGKRTINWGAVDEAHAEAIQADGKILVAGFSEPSLGMTVARLDTAGNLDPTFGGGDGIVNVGFGLADKAWAIALQADGKMVVAGSTGPSASSDIAVARLDSAGNLDPSFSLDGKLTIDLGGNDQARAVALQPDGKIVLGGFGAAAENFVVARLNTDGSADATFDTDGITTPNFGGTDKGSGIAIQQNGKIVVVGETSVNGGDVALARLQPSGALDTSFAGDGSTVVTAPGADDVLSVALQADGKILYAGSTTLAKNMVIGRFLGDGVLGAPVPTPGAPGTTPGTPGGGGTSGPTGSATLLCRGRAATIIGSDSADKLRGTAGPDVIVGLGGNDVISGLNGDDIICAGAGNDKVTGGNGKDTIVGGVGNDTLLGGAGIDLIFGQTGRDKIGGGAGRDRIAGGTGKDTYVGTRGKDRVTGVELPKLKKKK